jgi:hypothetical protein
MESGVPKSLNVFVSNSVAPVMNAKFRLVATPPVFGIPAGGMDFDVTLVNCTAGGILGYLLLINFGPTAGIRIDVVPHSSETEIILTDCDGYTMIGQDYYGWGIDPCSDIGKFVAPYRPIPANGATDVSTATMLEFVSGSAMTVGITSHPSFSPLEFRVCGGYPEEGLPPCTEPINPGMLQPFTTYRWQASVGCAFCMHGETVYSPVFTFTTGAGTVATKASTWGSVKAMYRE